MQILHAWGGKRMRGLYSEICNKNDIKALTVGDIQKVLSKEESYNSFFYACKDLLELTGGELSPCYDAILIDEGQDLVAPAKYKYEGKQPFYWMAYQSIGTREGCYTRNKSSHYMPRGIRI